MLRTLRPLLVVLLLAGLAACAHKANHEPDESSRPDSPAAVQASDTGKLFNDPPPPEGGWKGLARLLEALTPSVDTDIPLSASQITDRIATMLDNGRNQEALEIIEKRQRQLQDDQIPGTDVQLLFLHARALAALGQQSQAIQAYRDMTVLYPELPEPWNNLAAEYVKQGKLDMAHHALTIALTADPHYDTARTNLAQVLQMQAQHLLQPAGSSTQP